MTLYEMTNDFLNLLEMASEPDVDQEILRDTIEAVEGEIEIKADGYAKVLKELDGQTASLKAEIDRLTARKKTIENNSARIKKALEEAMIATGKTKFKTELFSFNIAKNPSALKMDDDIDIESLPAEYILFPAPTIDKAKVKEDLKAGKVLEWARLEQSESLRIK